MTARELMCPDCGAHGTWESFQRDDAAEALDVCPSCGSADVTVTDPPSGYRAELPGGAAP